METRFLETFLRVVEHGSMAEAARRLGLTAGAVAQRIEALETEIGSPLLSRSGRRVRPTVAGRAILDSAKRVVDEARVLVSSARSDVLSGELRLGAISTALTGILPDALVRLRNELPQVEVFVLPGSSSELYTALEASLIDAALLVSPPFSLPKSHVWQSVRREELMLLVPAHLAGRDPIQLLVEEPFVRYDRNNWGGRLVQGWLETKGIKPRDWLELDQLEAISVIVGKGLGVALLPDWAKPWPEDINVAKIPLPTPTTFREIGLLWNRKCPAIGLVSALSELLK